jgi:hypothetical protein
VVNVVSNRDVLDDVWTTVTGHRSEQSQAR